MSQTYITTAGRQALDDAIADGRNIQIASVIVDSQMLSEEIDPRTLTAVTHNPSDQSGNPAIYPVKGESKNGEVLIAWALPANSGGYGVNGLGFALSDGTLFAYQRRALGYKPVPDDDAFFEPRGTIKYKGADADNITVNLTLEGHFATVPDVNYFISEHDKAARQLMRKIEGGLGQVRIYTKANEVDPEFLPILGQTIHKTDYPDYFEHLGVVTSTLKLPDWREYGYIRQISDSLNAGQQLEDLIKSHDHEASAATGGAHTPKAYEMDFGTKSGKLVLNGRFNTKTAGEHDHDATVNEAGAHTPKAKPYTLGTKSGSFALNKRFYTNARSHTHGRGTMDIKGSATYISETFGAVGKTDGAFYKEEGYRASKTPDRTDSSNTGKLFFRASSGWSGRTTSESHNHYVDVNFGTTNVPINIGSFTVSMEKVPAHAHTATISSGGSHRHYVDVNFGTKTVNIAIGKYTPKLYGVPGHDHTITVKHTGGSETRPKTTVAVYAVKVKYLVSL